MPIPSRIGSHMFRRLTPVSRKAADNFHISPIGTSFCRTILLIS
jgi:hypothetical protein